MNFIVAGREEIESGIPVRTPYVVISITDPDTLPAKIQQSARLRDLLRLEFHDAVPVPNLELPAAVVLMNKDHAKSIWHFVRQWHKVVGAIVVQCEQGMSPKPCRRGGDLHWAWWRRQFVLSRLHAQPLYLLLDAGIRADIQWHTPR